MRIPILAASVTFVLAALSASAGVFFASEATFVSKIKPIFYLEDFGSFTFGSPLNGSQTSYPAPGGSGFGWTASAALGLYSNVGALSEGVANDLITITFTGNTVSAIGGNVANTDINGNLIPGTVTLTISDGSTQSITFPTASQGFLGYTSTVPITSITLKASSGVANNWVQLDHFYVGTAASFQLVAKINKLTILNGSNRLDAINLPLGNIIAVESSTNLLTWITNATVTVTNSTQTFFVPAINSNRRFFRLQL